MSTYFDDPDFDPPDDGTAVGDELASDFGGFVFDDVDFVPPGDGDGDGDGDVVIPPAVDVGIAAEGWPPGNGQGPIAWMRSYLDDITGIPISEGVAVRDHLGRLRDAADVDELDRDELMQGWVMRGEYDPPAP